jgi:lipid-A-disaccharide synthase
MIIVYKISPFAYFIAKPFLITPYIGLVNTLARRMIVPELLMFRKNYTWLAKQAIQLLCNHHNRVACIRELSLLMNEIAKPGASERAADEILSLLQENADKRKADSNMSLGSEYHRKEMLT